MCEQILHPFEAHENSEREKADTDQPMRKCFSIFRGGSVAEAPHQHQARCNFNHRINSKTDQRDTAGNYAGNNSDDRFKRRPADAQIFNSSASLAMKSESFS